MQLLQRIAISTVVYWQIKDKFLNKKFLKSKKIGGRK